MKHVLPLFFYFCFFTIFTFLVKENSCAPIKGVFGWREIPVDDPHLIEAFETVKNKLIFLDTYEIGYAIAKGLNGPFEYKICIVAYYQNRLPHICIVDINIYMTTPRYKLKSHLCGDVI